jgi:hypothetical protein
LKAILTDMLGLTPEREIASSLRFLARSAGYRVCEARSFIGEKQSPFRWTT